MNFLSKFDVALPRYTSFPSVPYWQGITESDWTSAFNEELQRAEGELSVYVHVPFCATPCAFCGCTRVIATDKGRAAEFSELLLSEARRKLTDLARPPRLVELHVGGGTPNWLPPRDFESLFGALLELFSRDPGLSFSVELDPRTLSRHHVESMARLGVNRVSLGVQDFHAPTLEAIRRPQSRVFVAQAVEWLRHAGIREVNFDLVYGLPFQTPASLRETARQTVELAPSRIALYGYAHVPRLKPGQRLVEAHGLPEGAEKRALSDAARAEFVAAGYREIGFDHFALPDDELWKAFTAGKLHRNFMGYTTQRTPCLIGLGPSSLSDCGVAYAQNPKELAAWQTAVREHRSLVAHGHRLSSQDLTLRRLILDIMCRFSTRVPDDLGSDPTFREKALELSEAGLIRWSPAEAELAVTELGRGYLRNVAALFDPYLRAPNSSPKNSPQHSQTA